MSAIQMTGRRSPASDILLLLSTEESIPNMFREDGSSTSTEIMRYAVGLTPQHNDQFDTRSRRGQEVEEQPGLTIHGISREDKSDNEEEGITQWAASEEAGNNASSENDSHHQLDQSSDELNNSPLDTTRSAPPSWLEKCRKEQDLKFPHQTHRKYQQGIWELDLLHDAHECYNAYMFTTLQPSTIEEQRSPVPVLGYGTVVLTVYDAKTGSQRKSLSLENVKYVRAPQDVNHRVGFGALPETVHLHLPAVTFFNTQGDGFLSISNGVGCALGVLDQGGRRVWKLRTANTRFVRRSTAITSKIGLLFKWGGNSQIFRKRKYDEGIFDELSL